MKPNQIRIGRIEKIVRELEIRRDGALMAAEITLGSPVVDARIKELDLIIEKLKEEFEL